MVNAIKKPAKATIDHKNAKSKGGPDTKGNMVLACKDCNQLKGNKAYDIFYLETAHHRRPPYSKR